MSKKGVAKKHGAFLHGKEHHMHSCWRAMILRCHDPKNQSFGNYGARGIFVCEAWNDLENGYPRFVADMGERPSSDHSIDRIDNDGPYSPENCRWATKVEQGMNRRTCRLMRFEGEMVPVAHVAKAVGVSHALILTRLKAGWSDEAAAATPVDPDRTWTRRTATVAGVEMPLSKAAKVYGLPYSLVMKRILSGFTTERALTQPRILKTRKGTSAR